MAQRCAEGCYRRNGPVFRFWDSVKIGADGDCWPWTGIRKDTGYGLISKKNDKIHIQIPAHRLAWIIANGVEVPAGLVVRHSCDNPPCCNPAHLLVGTTADNVSDKVSRSRQPKGSANGSSKLTPEEVSAIRAEFRTFGHCGLSKINKTGGAKELANRFGISESQVYRIAKGSRWKHLVATT